MEADMRPRDAFGRPQPHLLGLLAVARAVPGLAGQFQKIPDEFWSRDVEEHDIHVLHPGARQRQLEVERVAVAVVACPCGDTPQIRLDGVLTCSCLRVYTWTGNDVRVAFTPGRSRVVDRLRKFRGLASVD